ncbi:MAG: helix-turn-helix domain-containing protein [Clostridia bacterium]|nr:helix-turn-helix domain-containing protein [Clostridia bacterium]
MGELERQVMDLMLKNYASKSDFARKADLPYSTLDSIFKRGLQNASIANIIKLCNALNISADGLSNGKVIMINKNKSMVQDDIDLYKYDNILPITTQKIPFLGSVACGQPIYAEEDKESYIVLGTNIKADFCLRAQGDSMIDARIHDGDIVYVRKQEAVDNGEVAVVLIGDEATLKRVYYYPDKQKLLLQPANPKYEPFIYVGDELDQIRILGKAVAFQSDVK